MRRSAGLNRPRKNSPPFRALEGRNLIAGGNAPGKREIDLRPCRGRTNWAVTVQNGVRLRGIDPFRVGLSMGGRSGGVAPAILCIPCGDKSICFIFRRLLSPALAGLKAALDSK